MADTEILYLTDEDDQEIPFRILSRLTFQGKQYAILEEIVEDDENADEEEGSVMVFSVETEENGDEMFQMVEDEDESDDVFYYWQAGTEDYEFTDAV